MSIFGRRRADQATAAAVAPSRARAAAVDLTEAPQAVLAFCVQNSIHPTPVIYETVYTYLLGGNSALNLALAAELARGPLTPHALLRLHEDHLTSGRMVRGIGDIGVGLGREVDQISQVVDAGIEAGASAKTELTRLTDALDRTQGGVSLFDQAREIREIGVRQLSANMALRETLRVTRQRLGALEQDLARHMEEANTDHLSKLPNRRAIDARLAAVFATTSAGRPACLIMVDIDHFKAINDTHGHDIGDSVIRMAADILKRDVGHKGFPARWGGEEFAVLFESAGLGEARRTAETIRRTLEAARWTRKKDGVPLGTVTASFGIAERQEGDSAETLTKRADAALYRAKSEGRNRCVCLEGGASA